MAGSVLRMANDDVAVEVRSDGSFVLSDPSRTVVWESGSIALQEERPVDVGHVWPRSERSICEQYPGRFVARAHEGDLLVEVLGRERQTIGVFRCAVSLDGPWVEFAISDVDAGLPHLTFPPPLEAESLVLPRGIGQWLRKPLSTRHFWGFYNQLSMRWFGGLRGDHGWIAVFHERHEDAGIMAAEMTASPSWMPSLGRWRGTRKVRYRLCSGGYVGLAKAFRRYVQDRGEFVSLAEKMEARPLLKRLHGGRILSFMQSSPTCTDNFIERMQPVPADLAAIDGQVRVHFTHREVADAVAAARAVGVERALVVARGWIAGGYDYSHPDVWPPEPSLGSTDDLKALLALDDEVVVALHDNYQDIYRHCPSYPEGVIRDSAGRPMAGGIWAGGQCYILNARAGLRYARRNWPAVASLGTRAMFVDTIAAVRLYESYDPGHELTRAEDLEAKIALMKLYLEAAQVFGSEESADFSTPYLDWIETRHHRVAGESIPLWMLVYHDSVFEGRYHQGGVLGEGGHRNLTDRLWGCVRIAGHRRGAELAESLEIDRWHAEIGAEPMTSHAYLDYDGLVERTEFASAALVANFGDEPWDGIAPGEGRIER